MNFNNTECVKVLIYGQFQILHQVNKQVGWLLDFQVDDYVKWQVEEQINLIQTKIEQEIDK